MALDPRFIHLSEKQLGDALGMDTSLLSIVSRIFNDGHATSEDMTVIWRNLPVYQQLMEENSRLLQFFHATCRHNYYRTNAPLNQRGADAAKPAPFSRSVFDLSDLREQVLDAGLSRKAVAVMGLWPVDG